MVDPIQSEAYQNIPIGDHVAREFPWWREGQAAFTAGAAYRELRFVFGPQNAPCQSDRERPIKITELRFIMDTTGERYISGEQLMTLQVSHSKYGIFGRWVPAICLNTEDDRLIMGDLDSAVIRLEYPYFLQRGTAFKMRLVPLAAPMASRNIDVCLRGWDPINKTPCVMNKVVALPVANAGVDVVFDENRDAAVRSMWIHDIVFGFTECDAATTLRSLASLLRVKFYPSMGPKWSDLDLNGIILSGLVHYDSGVTAGGAYRPTIIHRPKTPYILNPREVLTIKARNEVAFGTANTVYCWVKGTQEGRY